MSDKDREQILENLMGMTVEEVVDLIGDLTVRDALEVLRRRRIAEHEGVPDEDAQETVIALLQQLVGPFGQRITADFEKEETRDATRSNVAALAELLAHTTEAGTASVSVPTGLDPPALRSNQPFGSGQVHPGGRGIAFGTDMHLVSGLTVDKIPAPSVTHVARDRIEFTVPQDAEQGCVEIFGISVYDVETPDPITLRECVCDDEPVDHEPAQTKGR